MPSSERITDGSTYYFDQSSDLYFRFDARTGLDNAEKVELVYLTDLVNAVNSHNHDLEYIANSFPQSTNLIVPSKAIADSLISNTTGEVESHEGWYATDFMPIKKGVTYYTGGVYGGNNAIYDVNKKYVAGNVVSVTNYLGSFTATIDGYFRCTVPLASYLNKAYVSPYLDYYTGNEKPDFTYTSQKLALEESQNARGEESVNLLRGHCAYRDLQTTDGAEKFNFEKIATPYIAVSGIVYYRMYNGQRNDVLYCFEYTSAKVFVKYTTLSGKDIGYVVLDPTTAYVRFKSATASASYVLPDLDTYTNNLLVSDNLSTLGKQVTTHNVTGQSGIKHDFYDRSVSFSKEYIEPAIKSYVDGIQNTFYDFVMPMNTDLHTLDSDAYLMLTYMAELGAGDICFNLGDSVPSVFAGREQTVDMLDAVRLWNDSSCVKCPLVVLRGNHDNNPVNDMSVDKMIPDALWYNIMHNRTRKGFYKAGVNYGYLDFEQSKIRVIWIDSGDIYDASTGDPLTSGYNVMVQQAQFDWFCNTALDFSGKSNASEWSVITVSHAQIATQLSTAFTAVLQALMDGSSASGTASTSYGDYTNTLTYNVDYTSQGSVEYICHVNGHTHDDNAVLIGSTGRYDIDIACDNGTAYYYVGSTRTAYTRTSGTIEEHLMDTLCLDKKNRKIYMKRLGVGNDREFDY